MKKKSTIRPLLTVAIPAYNVAEFLERAVVPVTRAKYTNLIEIIIINDGSKDDTAKIGKNLEKTFANVRTINKENGGHGSTINVGIEHANGEYFRLLDGDDYFNTNKLDKFLEKLKEETSDIILTPFIQNYIGNGLVNYINFYSRMIDGKKYKLDSFEFGSEGLLLPCTTVKTDLVKKSSYKIDEHCFYVDQEYNMFLYMLANSASYYDIPVYHYQIGREGQSMTTESLKKNIHHHETVVVRLLEEYTKKQDSLAPAKNKHIVDQIITPLCQLHYDLTAISNQDRQHFLSFDKKLKEYPNFYNSELIAGKSIKMYRKTGGRLMKPTRVARKFFGKIK